MTHSSQRWIAVSGGVVLMTVVAFILLLSIAPAAQPLTQLQRAHGGADVAYAAAPLSQLQRAHGTAEIAYAAAPLTQLQREPGGVTYAAAGALGSATNVGRGGVFVKTTPVAASTAEIIGGIAVTALVIALIAFLALGSRASRRGELAPVTSLVQAPAGSPAAQYDEQERKAA